MPEPEIPHILLVEDDPAHAELIRRAFEDDQDAFRLSVSGSLAAGRETLARDPVDLVITDYRLPDGEGVELVPEDAVPGSGFPVVLMTSQGDEQVAVQAMKAGAVDYLVKSGGTFTDMPRIVKRALREWGHIRDRLQAQETTRRLASRLQTLHDVDTLVLSSPLTPAVGRRILTRLGELIPFERSQILIHDPETDETSVLASVGGTGTSSPAIATFEHLPVDTAQSRDTIGAPLQTEGVTVGCIAFWSNAARVWSAEEQTMITAIANRISMALAQTRLNAQIERHASELEQRVAERTNALEQTNARLQHEISERIEAENELATARDRLEDRVEERTATLRRVNDSLSQEIAERQEAEGALIESERRTRSIIESALDAVITMDETGRISGWNPQATVMFGLAPSDAIGRSLADTIVPEQYREAHRSGLERYLKSREPRVLNRRIELTALRSDGSEFPVELAISELMIEGTPNFSAFVRDITAQKETESILVDIARGVSAETGDAFAHSLVEHLGRLLKADSVYIAVIGDNGDTLRTTAVYADGMIADNVEYPIAGTPCETVIGKKPRAYESGVQARFPDHDLVAEMGIQGYVGAPLADSGNHPLGVLVVLYLEPVPEVERVKSLLQIFAIRVAGEIERMRSDEARESVERELTTQRALSMRSDRLRSLGEMSAGIAHELNQPLVGVRGLAEHLKIALDRGWDLPEEKIRDRAVRIMEQADRMTHIIEHIRMFSREAGRPESTSVQINDVVTAATDLLGAQFRTRGFVLEQTLSDDLPTIRANPFSLEEVLLNLIGNARDATEAVLSPGASMGDHPIHLVTTAENESVLVLVKDHGCGIPDEIVSKVFDPFFTTKEPDKGTGLGLAISRSIIDDLGGELLIDSKVGVGTTFTIRLPIEKQESSL